MDQLSRTDMLTRLLQKKQQDILSVYFTAGYPGLDNTLEIASLLQEAGADLIEIGIPYSDPVADGPTIQQSNQKALENGMSLELLMEQLKSPDDLDIPIILMGYFNPILQYGVERFCLNCHQRGISGLIIPDLPVQEYLDQYQAVFQRFGLHNIFLITPQTSDQRIRWIDEHSHSFIYAVSDASITGAKSGISPEQEQYFKRLQSLDLQNPFLIGFGISDHQTFKRACDFARGAIIGSAFINVLREANNLHEAVPNFIHAIRKNSK